MFAMPRAAFVAVPSWPGGTGSTVVSEKFDVTGYDKDGRKVFHVRVEAPNEVCAKLYGTAHLQRTPDGAVAVMSAIKDRGGGRVGWSSRIQLSSGSVCLLPRLENFDRTNLQTLCKRMVARAAQRF